jgi:hypothetical protein
MTTMIQLAAGVAVGVLICLAIIVFVFLILSDDVPRVGEIDTRKRGTLAKLIWSLAAFGLLVAFIAAVIHFLL